MTLVKTTCLVACLFWVSLASAASQASGPSAAERTDDTEALLQLERDLARAWIDGDRGAIDAMFADDWITTDVTGRRRSKQEVLGSMFGPDGPDIVKMDLDELEVRLFGNVAVVTGRNSVATADGTGMLLRFTDIAERRGGRWVFVVSHGTPVQQSR